MNKAQEWVAVDSPIVGTGRKPDVSYERKATDRIFMLSKRPNSLVSPPELDSFIRRTFGTAVSQMKTEKFRWIPTS